MPSIGARLKHAWNAFANQVELSNIPASNPDYAASYGYSRPDRARYHFASEKSIVGAIYTRLCIDIASIDIRHVRTDANNRYLEDVNSGLNNCLQVEANLDQAASAFRRDIAMTLFDRGVVALVPVDTSINPVTTGGFDIRTLRVGEITAWFPEHVRVDVYNQVRGMRQQLVLPKSMVAIIENPLYAVMNEPNSTLKRLINKLNLLDQVDNQSGSGKLDLIIQLPYVIKSEARREQAEQRRKDIEFQLADSKYGIAYTDGTEKITQLNRPTENNLMAQVEYLTSMLYGQLGLTDAIMNGTADEATMLTYWNRTVEPILTAVVEAMRRTFLTKTARSQNQSVLFFRDPFKLVPIGGDSGIAEIADKFSRNEILTSNEIRQIVGFKPSSEPKADQLLNSNMPQPGDTPPPDGSAVPPDPNAPTPPVDQGAGA